MKTDDLRGKLFLLLATMLAAVGWIASKLVILDMLGEVFVDAKAEWRFD